MNTVNVILVKTKADHVAAKERLRALIESGGDSDEISAQARLIQDFERVNFPIPDPDPIDALLFRMEQDGVNRNDLSALLGASTGRVSEILAGKRPLSIGMIRTLHNKMGIPGDILIGVSRKRSVGEGVVGSRRFSEGEKVKSVAATRRALSPVELLRSGYIAILDKNERVNRQRLQVAACILARPTAARGHLESSLARRLQALTSAGVTTVVLHRAIHESRNSLIGEGVIRRHADLLIRGSDFAAAASKNTRLWSDADLESVLAVADKLLALSRQEVKSSEDAACVRDLAVEVA